MIYRCDLELYAVSGPSCAIDTACSSSMSAVENAYRAMKDGLCDSAIVGGCNLCVHPYLSFNFFRLGILSPQGACRSFDRDGMHLSSVRSNITFLL
jgi:fatty acid synthase